ncbi:B12-binding domain-containing radical SAM protein [Patescibacteria group bacterium]
MRIVFANPPFVVSKSSNKNNNFQISGMLYNKSFPRKWLWYLLRSRNTKYGVRAGARWTWYVDKPNGAYHYPFMMGYSVALLRKNGFDALIYDSMAKEEYSYNSFIQNITNLKPDIVIIETSFPSLEVDLWLSKTLSDYCSVGLSGPHINTLLNKLKKYKYIKYLLPGEYINSSLEMAKFHKTKSVFLPTIAELDDLPMPFRDYNEITRYHDSSMSTKRPQLQVYGGKGCPFRCTFCLWPQAAYAGQLSLRSPKKVAKEIKHCRDKYGFKSVFFDDDTFNIGQERVSKLCDELKKIGLPWTMMGRLDASPDWLFDKMVDSGCVGMRFGVESLNSEILKNIKKGLMRENILGTVKKLSNKHPKLMLRLLLMKNLPGQTTKMHQEDLKKFKNLGFSKSSTLRQIQIADYVPLPGTEMYKKKNKDKA